MGPTEPSAVIRQGVFAVATREWRRVTATPRLWLFAAVIPAAMVTLLMLVFIERTPLDLPMGIVDFDHSDYSRTLTRRLDATPSLQVTNAFDDMNSAGAAMRRGETYAVLAVPPDYGRDIGSGRAPRLQLYSNRQMLTAGNIVVRDVRLTVATLGAELSIARASPPALVIDLHPAFNPGFDYSRFLALPLALAVLHIAMTALGADVTGRELRDGSAGQWLDVAGGRATRALLGKLLPYALWFSVFGLILLAFVVQRLGLSLAGNATVWATSWILLVLASLGLGSFLVGLTGNLRLALSLASVIVSPAFAYSGITYPMTAMSGFANLWAHLLPLGNALSVHTQQLLMGAVPSASFPHLAALVVFAILPFLLLRRWHLLLSDPSRWGGA